MTSVMRTRRQSPVKNIRLHKKSSPRVTDQPPTPSPPNQDVGKISSYIHTPMLHPKKAPTSHQGHKHGFPDFKFHLQRKHTSIVAVIVRVLTSTSGSIPDPLTITCWGNVGLMERITRSLSVPRTDMKWPIFHVTPLSGLSTYTPESHINMLHHHNYRIKMHNGHNDAQLTSAHSTHIETKIEIGP